MYFYRNIPRLYAVATYTGHIYASGGMTGVSWVIMEADTWRVNKKLHNSDTDFFPGMTTAISNDVLTV